MTDLKQENHSMKLLKLPPEIHKRFMQQLRIAFKFTKLIAIVKGKYRLKRGLYECQSCGNELKNGEYDIDHNDPIIAVNENPDTGYNYQGIVERCFDVDNLSLICKICHKQKCGREMKERHKHRPRTGSKNGMFGKKHSKTTKKKQSDIKKGKKYGLKTKQKQSKKRKGKQKGGDNPYAVGLVCIKTGREWGSIMEAHKDLKMGYSTLKLHLRKGKGLIKRKRDVKRKK